MAAKKPKKPEFLTRADSSFSDGYDLEGEAEVLKDVLEADSVDVSHPMFARLSEYEDRLRQFRTIQATAAARAAANPASQVGNLESDETDKMLLHTRDAAMLFAGRVGENGQKPITGGKRVAASLRQLWALSANDNPYADYGLVQFDQTLGLVRQQIAGHTTKLTGDLEAMRTKGLSFSILRSQRPAEVELTFVSPYGYSVVNLMVEFDYLCRVTKSAQRRDIISSDEAHRLLFQVKKAVRAVFEPTNRAASLLMREEMRPLCRVDFVSTDDEQAKKRVEAATKLFGACPRDIFVGKVTPRHTRRSVRLSEEELRLLETVPLADETAGADAQNTLID